MNIQMKQMQSDGSYENLYPVAALCLINVYAEGLTGTCRATQGSNTYYGDCVGGTAIISVPSSGNYTVSGYVGTILVTNTQTVTAQEDVVAGVSLDITISFSTASWSDINTISEAGSALLFQIGDAKSVTTTLGTFDLQIVGLNHDTKVSGGTAGISLMMKNCTLNTPTAKMNDLNTNLGGWNSTLLYTYCNNTFYNALPSDLKSAVKQVVKKTSAGSGSSTIENSNNYCWLASHTEVGFTASSSHSLGGEGTAYPIFTNDASRIKYLSGGTAQYWWLRSPYLSSTAHFCVVLTGGTASAANASDLRGVVVGLCI